MAEPEYDVFISHASADKPGCVELLADRLRREGIRVWYDDFSLGWGDSISTSIAKGLTTSRYGIVILSRSFLREAGSRHELRGLWQREIHVGKTILPILHDITLDEVRAFDPSLADLRAMDTSTTALDQIIATTLRFLKGEHTNGHAPPPDLLDVHRLADLSRLGREEVLKRLERYGTAARLNPGNGEVVMGLALIYLSLRRFPEAIEKFASAVELFPASGKAHLYYALSLMKARKPKTLSLTEARQILQALETATSLEPREGLCDLLSVIIKEGYFRMNGLRVPPPAIERHRQLVGEKRVDGDELAAFRDLSVVHDQTLLNVLMG
ncbi:MAG TPA: TIR domain-containing protein [Longimicrobium sp.]|nr:TIR domain-containing protein [Longimicrobium sp.]